jgi:hypothetical protein
MTMQLNYLTGPVIFFKLTVTNTNLFLIWSVHWVHWNPAPLGSSAPALNMGLWPLFPVTRWNTIRI